MRRPVMAENPHWVMITGIRRIIDNLRTKEPTTENRESLAIYEDILARYEQPTS
jgi:hypothetical protein